MSKWKLIFCPGSGGWSHPKPKQAVDMDLPPVQLFDLSTDIAEQSNLAEQHPEVVGRLTLLMEKYVQEGRTAGPLQAERARGGAGAPTTRPGGVRTRTRLSGR